MTKEKINTLKIELELASYDELPSGDVLEVYLDEILETATTSTHVGNVTATIRVAEEAETKDVQKEPKK